MTPKKLKPVAVYIATPDVFVEATDIPNAYNLKDFIVAHAVSDKGENLDHMLTFDLSGVDYSTPGDYAVYAMAMDTMGHVDSDYLLVHVLNQREASQYEKTGTFPGLDDRLRQSQYPQEDDDSYVASADASQDSSTNDGYQDSQESAQPKTRKKRMRKKKQNFFDEVYGDEDYDFDDDDDVTQRLEKIKDQGKKKPAKDFIPDLITVGIIIVVMLIIGLVADMFI